MIKKEEELGVGFVLLQSFGLLIVAGFALIMPHITTHSHNILAKIPENWMTSLSFFQRSCLPHDHTLLCLLIPLSASV